MSQNLKEKLNKAGKAFGPMVFEFFGTATPILVANSGSDFALFDMEHSGLGFETLKTLCAACRGSGIAPLARIAATEYSQISRALDVGAHGIMVPMVETGEQAEYIARSAHYPPYGRRGAAFGVAHDNYQPGEPAAKLKAARERTLVIAQIETEKGLENVEAIAATKDIDVIWLGHFDLTNFLGIPGQFENREYLDAVRRIVATAKAHKKTAGFMISDESWAKRYWDYGFRMIAFGPDHTLLRDALRRNVELLSSLG